MRIHSRSIIVYILVIIEKMNIYIQPTALPYRGDAYTSSKQSGKGLLLYFYKIHNYVLNHFFRVQLLTMQIY